jgi:hypothetical protein
MEISCSSETFPTTFFFSLKILSNLLSCSIRIKLADKGIRNSDSTKVFLKQNCDNHHDDRYNYSNNFYLFILNFYWSPLWYFSKNIRIKLNSIFFWCITKIIWIDAILNQINFLKFVVIEL